MKGSQTEVTCFIFVLFFKYEFVFKRFCLLLTKSFNGLQSCGLIFQIVQGYFLFLKSFIPLSRPAHLEKIDKKKTANPINFRGAPMVITFFRSAGDRIRGV